MFHLEDDFLTEGQNVFKSYAYAYFAEVINHVHFKLLSEPRFQCIEKIKTIGETYMAAAGIKPESQVSSMKNFGTKNVFFG